MLADGGLVLLGKDESSWHHTSCLPPPALFATSPNFTSDPYNSLLIETDTISPFQQLVFMEVILFKAKKKGPRMMVPLIKLGF